jgi:hypothetical protein
MKKLFLGIFLLFFVLSLFAFNESALIQKYNLRKKVDEMEGITWYHSKLTPKSKFSLLRMYNHMFYLYFAITEENTILLRFRVQIETKPWVFFKKIIILVDGKRYKKYLEPTERKTDMTYPQRKIEWYDIFIEKEKGDLEIFDAITNAKEIKVRCSGDNNYVQFKIRKKKKQALIDVLNAYKELQE